jgi:hypothetical protein
VNGRKKGISTEPDLPEQPEYGNPSKAEDVPDMGTVLAPSFKFSTAVTLREGKLIEEDIADINEGRKFLCTYGFVRYKDSFEGTPVRETRFCYVYDVTRGGTLVDPKTREPIAPDAFRVGGPSTYNEAT